MTLLRRTACLLPLVLIAHLFSLDWSPAISILIKLLWILYKNLYLFLSLHLLEQRFIAAEKFGTWVRSGDSSANMPSSQN